MFFFELCHDALPTATMITHRPRALPETPTNIERRGRKGETADSPVFLMNFFKKIQIINYPWKRNDSWCRPLTDFSSSDNSRRRSLPDPFQIQRLAYLPLWWVFDGIQIVSGISFSRTATFIASLFALHIQGKLRSLQTRLAGGGTRTEFS